MPPQDGRPSSRRRVLRRVGTGIAAGASLLAGCGQRPGPPETESPAETPAESPTGTPVGTPGGPDDERADYGTVVDMVEAGADPTGGEPINALLDEHAGDDTLLYFPEGEYLMDGTWQFREFERFAIVGDGAVVRPPDGYTGYLFAVGWSDRALDFRFRGITFDVSAPNTGIRPLHATIQDGLHVADVAVRGRQDTDQDSFRFDVTRSDGTGLVENLRMPDGGVPQYLITACYVGDVSEGELTFRDCHVAGFPDNGLYASQARGPVRVIGGVYENNNVANVRVSGGAVLRGVTVRSNEVREGFNNVRGIRLRSGRGVLVEDCDVSFTDVSRSDGAIAMHDDLQSATVRNTRVRVDTDRVPAVMAKSPAHPRPGGTPGIRLEDVQVAGAAAEGSAVVIDGRGGTRLSGVCISQTGGQRNGVRLIRSRGNVIRDSAIRVPGIPLLLEDATVDRRNVTTGRPADGQAAARCHELEMEPPGG